MFIYKITCLKNNKIYIGQTTKTIEERFAQHKNAAIKTRRHPNKKKKTLSREE